ncbi:MAG: UbiA family prenyltransferase [Planctomycetota bacterium]|nr:UbiA family prenyltransferase [Planctomycetota bacterium]
MKSWLRLLRVSLAPTAAADAAAGVVYACGGFPADARAWWLVPASLGVYHGALALNDWNDREHDARSRPSRPIPSGSISPALALATAIALFVAGLVCAWLAAPSSALWMGGVAALAVLYDVAGRGAWRGPLLIGLCRAGNLGSGIWWAIQAGALTMPAASAFLPAFAYGLYVFTVARLGRLEDGEDERPLGERPRVLLTIAAALLASIAVTPTSAPILVRAAAVALAIAGAAGLLAAARPGRTWSRGDVERAMGIALRRLLVASAVVALLAVRPGSWDGALVAAAILLGFPLAHGLRRVFPPS